MRVSTIARIIEESPVLTEQDGDGWTQRHWRNHRNGKYYVIEYTSTEHEDARTVTIHSHRNTYFERTQSWRTS